MTSLLLESLLAMVAASMIVSLLVEGTVFFWETERWWLYPLGSSLGIAGMTIWGIL